jgi:hypothetical protein
MRMPKQAPNQSITRNADSAHETTGRLDRRSAYKPTERKNIFFVATMSPVHICEFTYTNDTAFPATCGLHWTACELAL